MEFPAVDGRTDTLTGLVAFLSNSFVTITRDVFSFLRDFIDGLNVHAGKIEEIRKEIEETSTAFSAKLQDFSKDMKLLEDYYSDINSETKAIVDFGTSKSIPNIRMLIDKKDYCTAIKEIKSFLSALARRIEEVSDKLKNHDEKDKETDDLKKQVKQMIEDNGKSEEQMKNHLWHVLGKHTLYTGTMFLVCRTTNLFLSRSADISEIISFITPLGIQGLRELANTYGIARNLQDDIEANARSINNSLRGFHDRLTKFQEQIGIIVRSIKHIDEYQETLQRQLQDQPDKKTVCEWQDISVTLQQMLYMFEKMQKLYK